MDTFVFILRIILIVIASLVTLFYILFQFYQKVDNSKFNLTTADYIIFGVVSVLFGFGTNNYLGLLVFVPLLLIKFVCRFFITPKKLTGSGRWIEINWKRLLPKGFEGRVPKAMLDEMTKGIPKDAHLVIPKLYFNILIHFLRKKMLGDMSGAKGMNINAAQKNQAMTQFSSLVESIKHLRQGQTETKDLQVGVLKVTRL